MAAWVQRARTLGRVLGVAAVLVVAVGPLGLDQAGAGVSYEVLHRFTAPEGAKPAAPLIQATDGNFYGTTAYGGSGGGTVFKLTPSGTLTTLYSFTMGADGVWPTDALLQAADGNFYGTTSEGGAFGQGTVFKLTPDGTLTTLHSFTWTDDGGSPHGALIHGTDGNFYGTTQYGGGYGGGTVFRLTPDGVHTTLHAFTGGADGSNPEGAALLLGNDGNFYGTTRSGGSGGGTVFKLTPSGTLTTLHVFTGGADGAYSRAPLIQATDGNFYGTTRYGGTLNAGTVFQLTPSGTLTTLHAFTGGADGAYPYGSLLQATDGNFYGTTREGGTLNAGTVFQLTPSGTLTTLHAFAGGADGAYPEAALIQAVDGTFYGTAYQGGIDDNGTVFKFTFPLTNAAITASLASPQPVGTALTLTAAVTGGTAPQQCKWLWTTDPSWTTYSVLRTWQACTTAVPWTPTVAGSYQVGLWARSAGNPADYPEDSAVLAYTITAQTPLTITGLTASLPSPQPVGTAISLSATVTGGTAPQQCKWLLTTDPSWATYTVLRTWQSCTTPVPWTPTVTGSYQIGLWARSNGSTVDYPEASAAVAYTITPPPPLRIGALSASLASPQPVETPLTFTASVTGGTAPQQCKWLLTTDPAWATYTTLRTWQACSTAVPWTPTVAGSYQIGLWARNSGNIVDYPEASAALAYTVTGPAPLRIAALSANIPSPQPVATALALTATVTGGTAPQQCKWLLSTDPAWATYTTLRTWQPCTTPVPWTPTVAGSYQIGVWARSSGNTVDYPEASAALAYTIAPMTVTVTATPPSPQPVGTTLSLSASVTGGTGPQQCKWLLSTDPSWATYTTIRTWQACSSPVPWTPTVVGTYQVGVWARSAGNTIDYPEASTALSYAVTPMTVTVTGTPPSPQVLGTALSLSAVVSGGTAPQQCKWFVTTDPTWATYTILRTWQACSTPVPWAPTGTGSYVVAVWARSAGSTVDYPEAGAGLAYEIVPNLAGNWNYSESGTLTLTVWAEGQSATQTEPISESGVVTVGQTLTAISWTSPWTGYGVSGTMTGNAVRVSGPACVAPPESGMTITASAYAAQGTVSADGRTMNLTGFTSCEGTGMSEGILFTFRMSGPSTVVMRR